MKNISSDYEKLYIDMCEKAIQLQTKWIPRIGDTYIYNRAVWIINNEESLKVVKSIKANSKNEDNNLIWILDEEDIQEILYAPTMENYIGLLYRFTEWIGGHKGITDVHMKFPIKHLWLSYLMFHLYGMTWVDKNWKKVDYGPDLY